jgi:hypothetical protein
VNATRLAGYSGTPLAAKLGIKEGSRVLLIDAPEELARWLPPLPAGVKFATRISKETDIVHVFSTHKDALATHLAALRGKIRDDAVVWVSWPKQASKMDTDITEDAIRTIALPLGFVDVKVCAVSEVWSGLKLMIRKQLRAPAQIPH